MGSSIAVTVLFIPVRRRGGVLPELDIKEFMT